MTSRIPAVGAILVAISLAGCAKYPNLRESSTDYVVYVRNETDESPAVELALDGQLFCRKVFSTFDGVYGPEDRCNGGGRADGARHRLSVTVTAEDGSARGTHDAEFTERVMEVRIDANGIRVGPHEAS